MTTIAPQTPRPPATAPRRRRGASLLALAGALVVAAAAAAPAAAQSPDDGGGGIGAWPSAIAIDDARRDSVVDRTLGLINGEADDQVFDLRATGDVGPWVTFHLDAAGPPVREARVGAGSSLRLVLRTTIPPDAPNRRFGGSVRASTVTSRASDASQQDVRVGVDIGLIVQVTGEQVLAGEFLEVDARATEVGLPLQINATLRNDGNVVVLPELHYVIRYRDEVTARMDGGLDAIGVGQSRTISQSWDTSEERPGPYVVEVHAQWEGLDLGTREAAFELHPRGTLTRQGEFLALELVNEPEVGGVAQVRALFQNTGEVEARVLFAGVLERDGEVVGTVETPLKLVEAGQQEVLDIWLDVPERGTYRLAGTLNFEGKQTGQRAVDVPVPFEPPTSVPTAVAVATAAVLLTAGSVGMAARRERRRQDEEEQPAGGKRQLVSVGDR